MAAVVALPALSACTTQESPKTTDHPNIIFFLLDDFGWMDSSVAYGEQAYERNAMFDTPNMERLARMGVVMTSAYACPVSTPTRTSIMSGMHAARTHITSFTAPLKDIPTDGAGGGKIATIFAHDESPLRRGEWNWNGLSPVEGYNNTAVATPLVQLLQDAGYYTLHVGKAHWAVAGTPGATPYNMGFLVNIAGTSVGHPQSYQSADYYGNMDDLWSYASLQNMVQYYGTDTHLTQAVTQEALRLMDWPVEHGIPFFLNLCHFATHTPVQADMRFYQKYLDRGLDEGQARFASMVEGADKSLGEVLDYVESKGIADNTIIIFYGDNGGHSVDNTKGGGVHTQNLPLREGKGSCYEGGIREPMIWYIPGRTAPGTRVNTPVTCEDLYPTILELAGVKDYSTVQRVDGKSIVKLLTDGSQYVARHSASCGGLTQIEANRLEIPESVSGIDPLRPMIFHYPHQWRVEQQKDIDYLSSLRRGDWKIVYRMADKKVELYNLASDIAERNDLSARYPERVQAMARELGDSLRAWNATMPVWKSTGRSVAMPDEI